MKCNYILENKMGLIIFLSENTLVVNTCFYTTEFTPIIQLLPTMRPLLAVGRLVVAVTAQVKTAVLLCVFGFVNFVYEFLRI
jgi:hypothetical protein